MINPAEVEAMIKAKIPDAEVCLQDMTGGGDHYEAIVISSAFEGKRPVQQHQLVYSAVQEAMASNAIHALGLKTYTPAEWTANNQIA